MPAAWESQRPNPYVFVGCPIKEVMIPLQWALFIKGMNLPFNSSFLHTAGTPIDIARNNLVRKMFEVEAEYIFFLDSDVVPRDLNVVPRLLAHKKPIVSGLYYKRHDPWNPCMEKVTPNGVFPHLDAGHGLVTTDYIGAGCMLVHRSVFERVPKPWFKWTLDPDEKDPDIPLRSEDYYFNHKARRAGYQIYVDTSVECDHYFYAKVGPTNRGVVYQAL